VDCERAALPAAANAILFHGQRAAPRSVSILVVAGAVSNSLVCAAYWRKPVTRSSCGGRRRWRRLQDREVCLRGFKRDLCSSVHSGFSRIHCFAQRIICVIRLELLTLTILYTQFADGPPSRFGRTWIAPARVNPDREGCETYRRLFAEFKAYSKCGGQSFGAPGSNAGWGSKYSTYGVWQRRFAMSVMTSCANSLRRPSFAPSILHRPFQRDPGRDPGTGGQLFGDLRQQATDAQFPKGGSGMLSRTGRFWRRITRVVIDDKPAHGVHHRRWQCSRRALRGRTFVSARRTIIKPARHTADCSRKFSPTLGCLPVLIYDRLFGAIRTAVRAAHADALATFDDELRDGLVVNTTALCASRKRPSGRLTCLSRLGIGRPLPADTITEKAGRLFRDLPGIALKWPTAR